jgi:hypothetical protein
MTYSSTLTCCVSFHHSILQFIHGSDHGNLPRRKWLSFQETNAIDNLLPNVFGGVTVLLVRDYSVMAVKIHSIPIQQFQSIRDGTYPWESQKIRERLKQNEHVVVVVSGPPPADSVQCCQKQSMFCKSVCYGEDLGRSMLRSDCETVCSLTKTQFWRNVLMHNILRKVNVSSCPIIYYYNLLESVTCVL